MTETIIILSYSSTVNLEITVDHLGLAIHLPEVRNRLYGRVKEPQTQDQQEHEMMALVLVFSLHCLDN